MCREFGLRVSVNGGRSWHNVDTSLHINGLLCVLWSKCGIVTRMDDGCAGAVGGSARPTHGRTHALTHAQETARISDRWPGG